MVSWEDIGGISERYWLIVGSSSHDVVVSIIARRRSGAVETSSNQPERSARSKFIFWRLGGVWACQEVGVVFRVGVAAWAFVIKPVLASGKGAGYPYEAAREL